MSTHAEPYTIVVGVSATSTSSTALRWAVDLAALRGARVVAVRVWRQVPEGDTLEEQPGDAAHPGEKVPEHALRQLEMDVSDVLGEGHGVECRLVHGGRRKGLIAAAAGADLLVIDAPRRMDLSAEPLFAQRLINHAHCPVVVMPPEISGAPLTPIERAGQSIAEAAGRSGRPGMSHPPDL
jgi:nucleotide-binding universal stress UspA family protein